MPNLLFDYIDVIKNEFMKYFFVFISGFFHYYYVSKDAFFIYTGFVILNYIYIYNMYILFNKYQIDTNFLQDKMYETLVDCLNNLVSIYSFNQEKNEKERFYNTSFIEFKNNLYKTKEVYIKGDLFWSVVTISMFIILNYYIYKSYKKNEITSEKLVSTFIITFSIIGIFDNSERCAYNISRIHSQINDAELFFNKISSYNKNNNKNVNKHFKNGNIEVDTLNGIENK
jgi:hypothetical protein